MEQVIFITIVILFLWALWRRHTQTIAELRFRSKIFALRDELRRNAFLGNIDIHSPEFVFFDRTFCQVLKDSYFVTLFFAFLKGIRQRNGKAFDAFVEALYDRCLQVPALDKIRGEYEEAVKKYMIAQHFPMLSMLYVLKKGYELIFGSKRSPVASAFYSPRHNQNGGYDLAVA